MFQRWPKCSAGKERMFFRTSTLKVHEAGCQKLGVERSHYPLTSPSYDKQRSRSGIGLAIEETEFWVGLSVCPPGSVGLPPASYFLTTAHTTWPLTSVAAASQNQF